MIEFAYESLNYSSDNDQEEEKNRNSEIICSEKENDPKTNDIVNSNKT